MLILDEADEMLN